MPKIIKQYVGWDSPEKRDYQFKDFFEYGAGQEAIEKRPKNKIKIWNQKGTPACSCYGTTHIVNAYNIIEDKSLGLSRDQIDPLTLWNKFCEERGDYSSGTSLQDITKRFKKQRLIEGYVTISNDQDLGVIQQQTDQALSMGKFILTGSLRGDWAAIKKTGIYTERTDGKNNGHIYPLVLERGDGDYYMCMNSYGDTRGPYKGYFKLYKDDLKKLYSKLVIIDKNDSHLFNRFEEIQKVKHAIALLRSVYSSSSLDGVKSYLEKIRLGENFSTLYGTVI